MKKILKKLSITILLFIAAVLELGFIILPWIGIFTQKRNITYMGFYCLGILFIGLILFGIISSFLDKSVYVPTAEELERQERFRSSNDPCETCQSMLCDMCGRYEQWS